MSIVFKIIAASLLLGLVLQSASASSWKTDFLNLMYIEAAPLSAEYCQAKGFPANAIYLQWRNEQIDVHRKVENNLLQHFRSKGLTQKESELLLHGFRVEYRKMAAESVAKGRIPCQAFREVLRGFSELEGSYLKALPMRPLNQ